MFSTLGNIFLNRPRQAENTDTRQEIRRHEPDQEGRRKKNSADDPRSMFDTDDNTTITVEALRAFLENFLKSLGAEESESEAGIGKTEIAAPEKPVPPETKQGPYPYSDGEAAKAAGVYQHVAQKVDKNYAPHVPEDAAAAPILGAADIRTINQLLEDLKPLTARGVEYLTIERSDSFLNSLVAAVEKAKISSL